MMIPASRFNLLRARDSHHGHRVSFSELFFDLVFVFGITQLSHKLLDDFTWQGAAEATLLFMAIWWVWVFTTWVLNWLDPRRPQVRLMLYTLMFAGMLLTTSLTGAFEDRALLFAGAYVAMQVGRTVFACWALRRHHTGNYLNFLRMLVWLCVSGIFWIAGGLVEEWRMALWATALAIEYASPALFFAVPGLGRSTTADWNISGEHMAERCGLFIIIALGESILVSGTTFAHVPLSLMNIASFTVAFVGTVAMWWVYFNVGAERATHMIATADDPGRMARLAYTYLHILLAAGIVLTAVGDEIMMAHPTSHGGWPAAIGICGGPLLYLFGNLLFKRLVFGRLMGSHLLGMAALLALMPVALTCAPLYTGIVTTIILVATATWEGCKYGEKIA